MLLLVAAFVAPLASAADELPEIVVTATKQTRTLEQTAASISSLDGDFLREIGARNFQDVPDYTANVSMSLNHSSGTFAVRGFATPDTNPGFDPSVGAVVDGVYYGRSQFLSAFFHDIDRFEVLRGPQGTLFGKNCTAGIVNLVTKAPTAEFESVGEVLVNGYGERSIRPAVSMPLGPVGLRVSGNYDTDEGGLLYNTYLKRPELDVHEHTTRVRMRYAGGALLADLEAFRSDARANNGGFQFSKLTDDMRAAVQAYDPAVNDQLDFITSTNFPSVNTATIDGAAATLDYDFANALGVDDLRLTSITAYARSNTKRLDLDADFSPIPFITDTLAEPKIYRQMSQELRVSGENDSLFGWGHGVSFVAGLYYARTRFHVSDVFAVENLGGAAAYCLAAGRFCSQTPQDLPLPTGSGGRIGGLLGGPLGLALSLLPADAIEQRALTKLDQQSPTYAAFGSFEHFVTPHWAIIGGLRYSLERKIGRASSEHQGELIPLIAKQTDHVTERRRSEHELSPKTGLKWQPAPDTEVYGTWAQGYKSGGFNGLPLNADNLEYEPERATSIELGAKQRLSVLGGPARFSLALFNTGFDNLQVSTFLDNSFVVLNAAQARSRGVELDLNWLPPIDGASIYGSVGFADAKYKSYPNAPARTDSDEDTQDLSGKRLALAPRWTASLVPAYRIPLDASFGAAVAVDVLYKSTRFLDIDDDPRKVQPATRLYNARLMIDHPGWGWTATLAAHNITNVQIYDQIIGQPLAPGNFVAFRTDRGRYYSVDFTLNL